MKTTINIKHGINDLVFDMPIETAIQKLGEATEVEAIDNAFDEPTTIMSYENFSLFFEGESPRLTRIDIADEEAVLFEKKIFDMEEADIIALMEKNGYTNYETEIEDWGERCVSYYNDKIDFYFEDNELQSVIIEK